MSDEIIVDGESVTVIEITTGQIGPIGPTGPEADTSSLLVKASNLTDLADFAAARDALGLGTAAVTDTGTGSTNVILGNDSRLTDSRTPTSHVHAQSDITDLTSALGLKADLVNGAVPSSQIPAFAINNTFVAANQAAMLALDAQIGDIAIRSDLSKTFVLQTGLAETLANWIELSTPTDAVTSVNGQTGSVVLGYSDVGAAPASHTHANTDITGLGTAAVANTGTGSSNVILGNDSRLTDTRTPSASSIVDAMISSTLSQSKIANLTTDLAAKAPLTLTLNQQVASYSLVLADAGKLVEISNGSANTLTVPLNSSQAFPVGTQINFVQTGAGQTTITPDSGVTINGTPTLKLRAQWSSVTLIKRATDTWLAIGDLAAS